MIAYRATLDVPHETLLQFTRWIIAHRRALGTRKGRRVCTPRAQAILVLRWFREDTAVRMLAHDTHLPISTTYRYLHEGITILADQAPDLHEVLERGKAEGWSHISLDGTLIHTNRISAKKPETGHDAWYSGKHKCHGGNVQVLTDPQGFPVWTGPVEPGSTHDITASRRHVLPALYPAAAAGLPTLTDKGYEGAGIGIHHPTKGPDLAPDNACRNALLIGLRALGERGNAILKTRWTALSRIRVWPASMPSPLWKEMVTVGPRPA